MHPYTMWCCNCYKQRNPGWPYADERLGEGYPGRACVACKNRKHLHACMEACKKGPFTLKLTIKVCAYVRVCVCGCKYVRVCVAVGARKWRG